jgi:cell division protease FtsH
MVFGRRDEMVFLGREIHEQRDYSEDVAEEIDREVRRIVDTCYRQAREALEAHRDLLDLVATTLLERETLTREDFAALMEGRELPELPPSPPPARPTAAEEPRTNSGRETSTNKGSTSPPAPAPA